MTRLILFKQSQASKPWVWWTDQIPEPTAINRLAELDLTSLDPSEVYILLDGRDVRQLVVHLPTKTEKQARDAAPYAIEDQIACPLSEVHVAMGPKLSEQRRLLAIVSQDLMAAVMTELDGANIRPTALWSDFGAVAAAGHSGLFSLADRLIYGNQSTNTYLTVDLEAANLIEEISGHNNGQAQSAKMEGLTHSFPHPDRAINLLQGKWQRQDKGSLFFAPFKKTAFLAASLFILWLGITLLEGWQAKREAYQLSDELQTTIAQEFGPTTTRAQLEARARAMRATDQDHFISLTSRLFEAMAEAPGLHILSMRYAGDGILHLSVNSPDFEPIAATRQAAKRLGLNIREGNSRQDRGQLLSELMVEEARP